MHYSGNDQRKLFNLTATYFKIALRTMLYDLENKGQFCNANVDGTLMVSTSYTILSVNILINITESH